MEHIGVPVERRVLHQEKSHGKGWSWEVMRGFVNYWGRKKRASQSQESRWEIAPELDLTAETEVRG